jgi:glycerophosphoryl diester phosphodiesterase
MNTILISHRGNISKPEPENENKPLFIDAAIQQGYDVEIDVWYTSAGLCLGHDNPQTNIDLEWLLVRSEKLWVHCKNEGALWFLQKYADALNYFWHQNDDHTLTSKAYVWSYPGFLIPGISITVVRSISEYNPGAKGYCSDYIQQIRDLI